MTLSLPAQNRTLSPLTGWDRSHWVAVADAILAGATRHASPSGALIRYPGGPGPLGSDVDHLEGFARTFMLAAFRIAGDPAGTHALAERYARGIAAGVDPQHPERWVRLDEHQQAKVEASALALGLHLTRDTVWARLDDRAQQQTIEYLTTFMGSSYPPNNWAWFRIMVSFFLETVGSEFSESDRAEDFALLDSFDLPGGWTADGVGRNFDHYCGWALPFYPMLWAQMVEGDSRYVARVNRYRERLDDYLDDALHLIGADGGPLIQGRSITYRFATAAPVWAAALHGSSRHDLGLLRRAASGQVRHFVDRGVPGADGILPTGWHSARPHIAQNYSGPGSSYWAAKGMLGLALPASHPVWHAVEQPLPIEVAPFARVLQAPGWLAVGADDGVVRVTNHGTDHRVGGSALPDAAPYAKFGYSTATAPVVAGSEVAAPLDGTVALVRNGKPSHRSGFAAGGVRALPSSELIGSSCARAHWPLEYEFTPDHGVSTYDGPTELGPLIDALSVVRGAWEVRFVRVREDEHQLNDDDVLRVGGWALTAMDATAHGDSWAASARLSSRVVALDKAPAVASGVLELGDATALDGVTLIPWVTVAPVPREWHVFGIHLGAVSDAGAPPSVANGTITWADGLRTNADLSTFE